MTTTVTITAQILSGNLFNEYGYDENASLDNYCDAIESKWRKRAESDFPGAKIKIDIDRGYNTSGCSRQTEIVVDREGDIDFPDADWYDYDAEQVYQSYDWAVESDSE